jgi:predicted glycoside hydrolase/deacetylase ChbG (UPF0249 family)
MKHPIRTSLFISLFLISLGSIAQDQPTLAQQLGYAPDAKLLIIHADDIGLAQSVNQASINAFENKGISSGSIMVPCPWTNDFARYYKENPKVDVGIHITLTSEWDYYKWGGILPASEIPSLLDENGYFYATVEEVGQHALPEEVEKEIRAQIDRAISLGIQPSHLDSHMGSVLAKTELIEIYMKMGMEYQIPVFVPRMMMMMALPEEMKEMAKEELVLVDRIFMLNEEKPGVSWLEAYKEMVEKMGPGLNQLIVHVAIDNAEMQSVAINHPDFGSAWRQNDLDMLSSNEFRELLMKNDIQLVGWKEIKELMFP